MVEPRGVSRCFAFGENRDPVVTIILNNEQRENPERKMELTGVEPASEKAVTKIPTSVASVLISPRIIPKRG